MKQIGFGNISSLVSGRAGGKAGRQPHNVLVSSQIVRPPFWRTSSIMWRVPPGPSPPSPFQRQTKSSLVRAEARGGVEHPAVVALVRVLARGRRTEFDRLNMERSARFRGEKAGAPVVGRRSRPISRETSARRTGCRARAGRSARARPRRTEDRRRRRRRRWQRSSRPDVEIGERRARWRPPRSAPCPAESAAFRGRARRSCGR